MDFKKDVIVDHNNIIMSFQVMDTGDGEWNSKVDSLCAMFPDQPRSTIDSVSFEFGSCYVIVLKVDGLTYF